MLETYISNENAVFKKGIAYATLGQLDATINCFLRVLEIDPEQDGAIEGLTRSTRKKKISEGRISLQ
ncbi:tetratricopeptide repeat protein [Methanomethylovorans hollandica]|uniref:tetratricopeptide repeat protein n=1 Tax=Methanomethylovorans hollandica TaxID=101192 RepID=UPI0012EA71CB|nr:tetratricopeptide repeat protein [Methanomethylovorans hollandica]